MIRLMLALSLAIFGTMMTFGQKPSDASPQFSVIVTEPLDPIEQPQPAVAAAPAADSAPPAEPEPIQVAASAAPADFQRVRAVTDTAAAPAPDGPAVVVTGSRVNLRARPAIDAAVLDQLPKGARAVRLGAEGPWTRIRDLRTGTEGYMSSRFLARADT